ncbi:hypothetical protein [Salipiger mangrovisoli]|uniref:Lipoprotein n=1 Tax=Salipiger mangrovisoli TaxID=2865933 RepID=A0ABR9X462_9RHOB|nr:hypothetical protein [Salipiger mangrovisoli]MBE9638331.1 hypothetical protein [Salipiger mangrovisoli]
MYHRATFLAGLAALTLAGCSTPAMRYPNATPEEVAAARYVDSGPSRLTLYTMINNRSDSGAHSSLMISAPSQRVVFDPAGSVRARNVPEVDDVLYGVTPEVAEFYARAHARETYRVRIQSVEVPPEVAEQALRAVQAYGPVSQTRCTQATSTILSQLPGFEGISRTWFPNSLADQLAQFPGVTDRVLREEDSDDKQLAVAAFEQSAGPDGQPNQ